MSKDYIEEIVPSEIKIPCDCLRGGMDIDGRICQKCGGSEYRYPEWVIKLITQTHNKALEEERQFILNVLDGIDEADRQMGNTGGGTEAIRLALKSRPVEAIKAIKDKKI